ncbi:class I SAM-dependent DNA methyltransferase [Chitinivibrio alkaliphilus]|uniref:SAM dependent methyltransferase n=1 Tax=Chitinivibrio alkaliphilus ACht1 TaxID=1313304 RepID=U7D958_9BACT|nr:class I SAM-dependent methyltransferase [Chitinivibrio alkaliphilus]ERP38924.1 SAM dependent methyltransferase [Chitinivibrio alkaliphilus ACht1]
MTVAQQECYGRLASFYDTMMSHVPYSNWVHLIKDILADYCEKEDPRLFEIGGGTGTLGSILVYEGFAYQGSDYSFDMCQAAWKKGLDYLCCDCRHIPIQSIYDLVFFCFDGINYLHSLDDYAMTFLEVHRVLAPGGLFLFDITTERSSRLFFNDYTEAESFPHGAYIRYCTYDVPERKQYNTFDIFYETDTDRYCRQREEHVQTVFPTQEVSGAIPEDLFRIVGMWEDFDRSNAGPLAERVHFLLQKR